MQNIGSEEFFIYVPSKQEAEALIDKSITTDAPVLKEGIMEREKQEWVKIPLAGPFVVYARLQDEDEYTKKVSC